MAEYLTPGVYVEETSFRARSIEGVPTNTVGITGLTQYGPVPYIANSAIMVPGAQLVTSYTEYERAYGSLTIGDTPCQVALAARAFFANGGRRLYVQRVFALTETAGPNPSIDVPANFAGLPIPAGSPILEWRARWPGSIGSHIKVIVAFRRSKNVLIGGRLTGVLPGAAVEVAAIGANGKPPELKDTDLPKPPNVRLVVRRDDGTLGYDDGAGGFTAVDDTQAAFHVTLDVQVALGTDRVDAYSGMELGFAEGRPGPQHPRAIAKVMQAVDPADEACLVWLATVPSTANPPAPPPTTGARLDALLTLGAPGAYLTGGGDGGPLTPDLLAGEPASPDDVTKAATGLSALAEAEDIAIVMMPDTVSLTDPGSQKEAVDALLGHCQAQRYRMAVVDPPEQSSISEVRAFRSQFDSSYAALYYPWLRIVDPTRRPDPGVPSPTLDIPPSGAVAGVYARTDIERGVHKAPANEVVLGITEFVTNVTFDRQSVLNPEGVNALRFFEGRANRVWGARTMSSDPEWKYVNVRRLFNFLEHSIDKSTQWAVFEPNNERLWGSIRQTIEDFLLTVWRTGALMGTKPEEAYFVRCDRTTMTQNDLDNGRLICLIGVAPTYPAEFVIFRIGQWTADAQRS